jgi:hypothetical protein
MKNKLFIAFCVVFLAQMVSAHTVKDSISSFTFQRMALMDDFDCDACGCSASGGSLGFSSMLNTNFVGLRYFHQSYSSRDGIFANSPWVAENFNTVQLWSKIPVTEKIQLAVLIPYHFHNRELKVGLDEIQGVGDASIIATYSIYKTLKDSTTFTHNIQVGAGVKLPTGKFEEANNAGTVNQSFQLGTGSWDYLFVSEYVIKKKNIGLNSMINYTYKTENQKQYQFGNQLNYGSTLFYVVDANTIQLVPQIGIAGEVYASNKQYGQLIQNTAGDVLFSKFGLEAGRNKLSVGVSAMLPINQNLASGNIEAKYRWTFNFNYTL